MYPPPQFSRPLPHPSPTSPIPTTPTPPNLNPPSPLHPVPTSSQSQSVPPSPVPPAPTFPASKCSPTEQKKLEAQSEEPGRGHIIINAAPPVADHPPSRGHSLSRRLLMKADTDTGHQGHRRSCRMDPSRSSSLQTTWPSCFDKPDGFSRGWRGLSTSDLARSD